MGDVASLADRSTPPTEKLWATPGRGQIYSAQIKRFPRHLRYVTQAELLSARRALGPGTVLDLGAGTGRIAVPFAAEHDGLVVAMDPSESMLRQLEPSEGGAPIRPLVGFSMDTLPFRDAAFDGAYSFGVLNRSKNWERIVRPIAAALKPDAYFVFNNRCLDAIRVWSKLSEVDSGSLLLNDLNQILHRLGLQVADVTAAHLLSPSLLIAQRFGRNQPITPVMVYALRCLLEDILADVEDVERWLTFERGLARLLPLESALQVTVVARPFEISARAGWRPEAIDPEVRRGRLRDYIQGTDATRIIADPGYFRLLCLLRPLVRWASGGDDLVLRVFSDRQEEMDVIDAKMRRVLHPGLRVRMHMKARATQIRLLSKWYRARARTHRFLSR